MQPRIRQSGRACARTPILDLSWLIGLGLAGSLQAQSLLLVATNATWAWTKGTNEASRPATAAWRLGTFNDAGWARGAAPFAYGEPGIANGTQVADMLNGYSTLFLRQQFVVTNRDDLSELRLLAVCDDGFVAWINGSEAARYNVPAPAPLYTSVAGTNVAEPVGFNDYPITGFTDFVQAGTNILAVQVFNVSLGSSDIVFDAELTATLRDREGPLVAGVVPAPGPLTQLTQITVTFSEPVTGVDAADLSVNGYPCTSVTGSGSTYTFGCAQPEYGVVEVYWDMRCGITDLAAPPNPFNPTGATARWMYELYDPAAPWVSSLNPPAGAAVRRLTQVEVWFSQPVSGVDAVDLLVNGAPATNVVGVAAGPYVFAFPAQPAGEAVVAWARETGIADLTPEAHGFAGSPWGYSVVPGLAIAPLRISEFMAENVSGRKDEDGEAQGWIEIHNAGLGIVSLNGWSLSDDPRNPGQWVFPNIALAPGKFLLVFASGKNRRPLSANANLHTNFKLAIDGEYLGLFTPESPRQAVTELAPQYPEQRVDYAYGCDANGAWRYYLGGTPGAANSASLISNAVAGVHFSVNRGFFNRPFNLSLVTETPGAIIRYTLDSSLPTLTNGFAYTNPLPISATRAVRAAAFRTNWLASRVRTHTYLYNIAPSRRLMPALSIVTASNNLFGASGIMEINPRNTLNRGIAWERPASVELIDPSDNGGFQVNCGLRVHGGGYIRGIYNYKSGSIPESKYSFRLAFRGDYGPRRLEYALIPEVPVPSFDSIVLRAGMNDATNPFLRDEFARRLEADIGRVSPRGSFVHLYLDGVYKGYYNPTEHIDPDFLQTYEGGGGSWDLIATGEVRSGDGTAWSSLLSYVAQGNLNLPDRYLELERRMDPTNFVEYLLPLIYGDTDDWPHNNWRVARERTATGRLRWYPWDAEWSFGFNNSANHNTIAGQLSSLSPPWGGTEIQRLFRGLTNSYEFRLLFADRVHKHLYNDGALTDSRIAARYNWLKSMIAPSVSGYSDAIGTAWIPQRRRYLTNHFAQAGLLASSNAPVFNQFGGRVPPGFALTLQAGFGDVYYTTNGGDPRVRFTNSVSPAALLAPRGTPVVLDHSIRIRARTRWGTNWSALTEATFSVEEFGLPLRITEIMYRPPGGEAYEFIELQNVSPVPIDISNVTLAGVEFRFIQPTLLGGGQCLVLSSDVGPALFAARYPGVTVFGQYKGNLANGGERLALIDARGRVIQSVNYQDKNGWPTAADGDGYSLEILDPNGDPSDPANWRASIQPGGSPGLPNAAAPLPSVQLSEIMADNRGAVRFEGASPAWIELYNAGATAADLTGWTLGDPAGASRFTFPAVSLPAGAYLVLYCDAATTPAGLHTGYSLNPLGQTLMLTDASGARRDAVSFGPQAPDYSLGRVGPDGAWRLTDPTPGNPNETAALAAPANLVINEFLANALPGGDDWIELYNLDAARPVALRGLSLGATNALFPITALAFCPPRGFVLLRADEKPGPNHVDFKLPAASGFVALYDQFGALLDRFGYTNAAEGVSLGRLPNGTGKLTAFRNSASPGTTNYLIAYTGAVLNEIMARNQRAVTNASGRTADWLELFNPNPTPFSLEGMSLSVKERKPGQWTFPLGVQMPPNSHLVVWCDDSAPASTNLGPALNCGRALPREGGGVYLFDTAGQLAHFVEYGFQLPDLSIGSTGTGWALLAAPTPGNTNAASASLGDRSRLRLNEWLANSDGADWLELYNDDPLPVDMSGFTLTDDPSLAGQTNGWLGPLSFIAGKGFATWQADADPAAGRDHLPFRLDALGATLRLYASDFTILDSVDYLVQTQGVSEGRWPDGSTNIVRFPNSPSPGAPNYLPLDTVVINETLPLAAPPLEPALELLNLGASPIPLGGWWLSDDPLTPMKYRIPDGTVLAPQGFAVFYAYQFNPAPGSPTSFDLHPIHGGPLVLSETDGAGNLTGRRSLVNGGVAERGVSFGRHSTSVGTDFVALSQHTFGADAARSLAEFRTGTGLPNAAPVVRPPVINEIMYHPGPGSGGATENPNEEFVELYNASGTSVPLFDPAHPTNTWRLADGVQFVFPTNTILPPHTFLLLVSFDPVRDSAITAAFRAKYRLSAAVPLLGPFQGRLANEGESLTLRKPISPLPPPSPEAGFVPQAVVENIAYSSNLPWPPAANGTGFSLQRLQPVAYGNEPSNWRADRPTPGADNTPAALDADGDGLPDAWEIAHGLDPNNPVDTDGAYGDPDRDGQTNWQEYLAETDPQSPNLLITGLEVNPDSVVLHFLSIAGTPCLIDYRDSLSTGQWQVLANLPALPNPEPRSLTLPLDPGAATRYFRLRTPPPTASSLPPAAAKPQP
jgi:hypothetical protein